MPNEFFPYHYLDNGMTLKVTDAQIDGVNRPDVVKPEEVLIDLAGHTDWKTLDLDAEVTLSPELANAVLPKSEHSAKPWRVLLVAASRMGGTRQIGWRQSEQLAPSDSGNQIWTGRIRFDRDDVGASVSLRCFVTRSAQTSTQFSGFADEPGLRLSTSEEWTVQIEPKTAFPGKGMKVEWINFKTCTRQILNENAETLYYLDLDQDPPILFLNEDIRDLKTLLSTQGHVGPRAAIRDALFHSIAQPVWVCLTILAASADCGGEDERLAWQESVLDEIAPHVYQDDTEEGAVERLVKEGCDPSGRKLLLQKLGPAVQSYLSLNRSTTRLFTVALPPRV